MSNQPPKKKGVLSRFSAFLASDSLSLGPKDGTPSPSPTRQPPQAAAPAQQQSRGASAASSQPSGKSLHADPSSSSLLHQGSSSPMIGPLESAGASFSSSAANSLQPSREDVLSTSSSAAAHGGADGSGGDAFLMFSIVAPSFYQQQQQHQQQQPGGGAGEAAAPAAAAASAASASADAADCLNVAASSAARIGRRGSSIWASGSSGETPRGAVAGHSRTSSAAARGDDNEGDSGDATAPAPPPETEEQRTARIEQRMQRLQDFFRREGVLRILHADCAVSPARQRDILARVAESDHDIELALATLAQAYGVVAGDSAAPPSDGAATTPSASGMTEAGDATPPSSSAAGEQQQQQQQLRRKRSSTVVKADLVTLLGPLLPSTAAIASSPSQPAPATASAAAAATTPLSPSSASLAAVNASLPASSPASPAPAAADGASPQLSRGRTINTGNVQANRYVAVKEGSNPQSWFFFGGEPCVVDYSEGVVVFGSVAALHSAAVPAPPTRPKPAVAAALPASPLASPLRASSPISSPSRGGGAASAATTAVGAREHELTDASLLALVREQIAFADEKVPRRQSPASSLSSEMSGRSFGEMVDLEEMVRSLH